MFIKTLNDYDYSQVDDRLFNHNGCIVDVGCSGWDWSTFFIGKKRVIGIDPYESAIDGVTFFEGLLGPVNGMTYIYRNGQDSTVVGEMNISNDIDYKKFPMMNWKTFKKTYSVEKVSVLKLNIEGGEYSLLMSLDAEDFKHIDQIVVSFHDVRDGIIDGRTQTIINYICEHGYSYTQLENKYGWGLFIKTDPDAADFNNASLLKNITIVTGMWDLGRGEINGWSKRNFDEYKQNFFKLLTLNVPMCVWIPRNLEHEVRTIRGNKPTHLFFKELEDFKTWFPFYEQHEKIRTNPSWRQIAGWLEGSPQADLPLYNPMMMTKMFMVNDSALVNPFNSSHFYWIDGGITNTVPLSYFNNGQIFQNIATGYDNSIVQIAYPYEPSTEIHGFEKNEFYRACGLNPHTTTSVLISRGGFWGGPKHLIHKYNQIYYNILDSTIQNGTVGADECLFTIAAYQHPELIERFIIDSNGLIYPFFEKIADLPSFLHEKEQSRVVTESNARVNFYVLGFNSPRQFRLLCDRMKAGDPELFEKTRKILVNNTLDTTLFAEYDALCSEYGFEEIHQENLGVCGGRQFIAEHFEQSDADFYMFFEDDMLINTTDVSNEHCRSGMRKYVPMLYNTLLKIMLKENFDFLKFSFSEFYGNNNVQWAWYNVPQQIRTENWPEYDRLPERGTDPNAPKTKFDRIDVANGVAYITGEVYYSNWPQIVSRDGNRKMFLETRWPRPYEQTWMSHIFQETKRGHIKPAILLASPIEHNRFDFYADDLRKES